MKTLANGLIVASVIGALAAHLGLVEPWEHRDKVGELDQYHNRLTMQHRAFNDDMAFERLLDAPTKHELAVDQAMLYLYEDDGHAVKFRYRGK